MAHRRAGLTFPDDGQPLKIYGSVEWIKFERTLYLNTWSVNVRDLYFYQADLGPDYPQAVMDVLRAKP